MILQVSGIFILAFAIGYLVGSLAVKNKKAKAVSKKLEKVETMFPLEKSKAERLN